MPQKTYETCNESPGRASSMITSLRINERLSHYRYGISFATLRGYLSCTMPSAKLPEDPPHVVEIRNYQPLHIVEPSDSQIAVSKLVLLYSETMMLSLSSCASSAGALTIWPSALVLSTG